jgi:anthranilate phosphoribosyltransferase
MVDPSSHPPPTASPPEFPQPPRPGDLTVALRLLLAGQSLSAQQTAEAFEAIMTGQSHDAEIAALLELLATRTPTSEELLGAARVMRKHVDPVISNVPAELLVDTAGTGGAPKTFNVSTAAAIIAAAALKQSERTAPTRTPIHKGPATLVASKPSTPGGPTSVGTAPERALFGRTSGRISGGGAIAKHGNRSRTGRGSAEVLEQLGVNINASREVQARCLEDVAVCFCFAIHHHPATRYVMPVRKALGFATIFNLLGPLTNPAGAKRQLMGVYDRRLLQPIAEALRDLGALRAMVVHSNDGLDELSISASTNIFHVRDGAVTEEVISPRQFGLEIAPMESVVARDLDHAVRMIRDVIDGTQKGPPRDMALLNAAATLIVAGTAETFEEGLDQARRAIDSGAAAQTLERLAQASNASES